MDSAAKVFLKSYICTKKSHRNTIFKVVMNTIYKKLYT